MKIKEELVIAVVGQGYVGLPLALAFGKKFNTLGFDISSKRIEALSQGLDTTYEYSKEELESSPLLQFTNDEAVLEKADVYIVTVPTPITESNEPDFSPLLSASRLIGARLKKNAVIVYESTVYPGATEELCIPVLEKESGLKFNDDFFVGYSPERIVPGDRSKRLENIVKITSGSTKETAEFVDSLYAIIIDAGTYRAESIQVAEAAKVIENIQRDLNISLVNELAIIFDRLGLDTLQVLEAAGTKWNFLPFRPGLVGGHCIGIDPYYLTHKAQKEGYHPDVILSGRRVNDNMGKFLAEKIIKKMISKGQPIKAAKVLVLGLSFKEDCADIRNTKVVDLIDALKDYSVDVDVHDPWVDTEDSEKEYGIVLTENPEFHQYHAVVIAVPHEQFKKAGVQSIKNYGVEGSVLFDIKGLFDKESTDGRL